MSGPDTCFVTIALEFKTGRLAPAGFLCLWSDELTFVGSVWVRLVTPVIGVVPNRVLPTGSQDSRVRTRIRYADIIEVASHKRGWVVVRTRSGRDHFFGGGQLNGAFDFPQVSAEIGKALSAAGYPSSTTHDTLSVGTRRTAVDSQPVEGDRVTSPAVQLQKVRPADHDHDSTASYAAAGSAEYDMPALAVASNRERTRAALRAIALGAAGALVGAAAYATFTVVTNQAAFVASAGLGLVVAIPVGRAGAALGPWWTRGISVALTALSLLLSEYFIVRHFAGVAIPFRAMVTVIHVGLSDNKWTLLFWGISLYVAWLAPNFASSPLVDSPRSEDAGARRRLQRWILGPGIWVTAAAASALGLAALITLGALDKTGQVARDATGHVTKATAVPFLQVRTGDCLNFPPGSYVKMPEVPCQQPHDAEVYYTFDIAAEHYPGPSGATKLGDACGTAFPDVAAPFDKDLDYTFSLPDQSTWELGYHRVVCVMLRTDTKKLDGPVPKR